MPVARIASINLKCSDPPSRISTLPWRRRCALARPRRPSRRPRTGPGSSATRPATRSVCGR